MATRSSHGEIPPGLTLYTFTRTDEKKPLTKWLPSDEQAREEAPISAAHKVVNEVTGEVVFHNETYC